MTPEELALIGVDSATILYCLSWGAGVMLTFWSLGFATGAVCRMLDRL